MYSIGEFSRISELSIKALRVYHKKGILVPSYVDESLVYRHYDRQNLKRARIINHLREMDFSLKEISEVLNGTDDADVVEFFEKKRQEIESRVRQLKEIIKNLGLIIGREKEAIMALKDAFEVEEKELDTLLIAGVRFKRKYDESGEKFTKIAKVMGHHLAGKAFSLFITTRRTRRRMLTSSAVSQ